VTVALQIVTDFDRTAVGPPERATLTADHLFDERGPAVRAESLDLSALPAPQAIVTR